MKSLFHILASSLILSGGILAETTYSIIIPDGQGKKLLRYCVHDSAAGLSIEQSDNLKLTFPPTGLTLHPNKSTVIVHGANRGGKETFAASVNTAESGRLKLISNTSLAQPAGYSSIDRSGRYFLTAHYRTGTLASYPINKDGSLGPLIQSLKTPNQEAHCILTTPDNRFLYVPCVKNNNALYQFSFDQDSGKLTPLDPFDAEPPAMFGPRHFVYHPTLPLVYFSNEQQVGISVYQIGESGQLNDLQHATTMARRGPYQKGRRDLNASDIAISPDGKLLFSAMRDFNLEEDSVFTFRIEEDGRISKIARSKVGDIPWKIDVSPEGKHLIVCESGDSTCSIYRITEKGSLQKAHSTDLPSGARDMVIVK